MRDLEIRGAGNLLGPEQHGFMATVGFDLYCRMVDEVVQELQGTAVARRPEPELSTDLPAWVPDEYVSDRDEKLDVYRRLAAVAETAALDALRAELEDRFGPPPPEVSNLLDLKGLRLLGRDHGVERLRVSRDRLEIEVAEDLGRDRILALVTSVKAPLEFAGKGSRTLRVKSPGDPLSLATNLLQHLGPPDTVPRLPLPATGT
jgi:transcription-repair coupling factor (superfamily II helicase)